MKKLALLLLAALVLGACKDEAKQQEEPQTSETSSDTIPQKSYSLSLAQWSLNQPIFKGEADPTDFAKTASEMGFEGLEYVSQLYVNENVTYPMKGVELQVLLDTLKARSDRYGMQNLLIMIDGEGDLSFDDEAKTKEAIENHKKWVDAAAFLGCHSIRVNLFGEQDPEAWVKNSVRSLKALCEYAAPKNVNIIVENHGGLSSDAELLVRVMEGVAMENVGTLPDFGNFCLKREGGARWGAPCIEEYDKYKGTEILLPYAKGVSAKSYEFDANGDETTIDYYKMMDLVKASNFEGFIGIEFEGEAPPAEGIEDTKELVIKALKQ